MGVAKQDINDFNKRVKRIKNPRNKTYYDPELGIEIPKRLARKPIKKLRDEPTVLSIFVVSMVFGAFAFLCAEVLRIRYFELSGSSTVITVLEVVIALWVVLMIAAVTDKRTFIERTAQLTGVIAMMAAGHNLVWRWPDQMAYIYTPAHVEYVLDTTEELSIVYRGSVYGF